MSAEKKEVSSTLETLKSIKARETTVGAVDKKVAQLIDQLESGDEEAVLKTLVRSETHAVIDSKKWKRTAFYGMGISLALLACVFGLTVLSIFLAKDVFVNSDGDHPAMTSTDGQVLAVAAASSEWSLSMTPNLPDHLLKTLTEVTITTPLNSTLSLDVVAREKSSVGALLETSDEHQIIVTNQGRAFMVLTERVKSPLDPPIPYVLSPPDFPDLVTPLLHQRGKRIISVQKICGLLKCASFSIKEDEELRGKERRLQSSNADCDAMISPYVGAAGLVSTGTPMSAAMLSSITDYPVFHSTTPNCVEPPGISINGNNVGLSETHTFADGTTHYGTWHRMVQCAQLCTDAQNVQSNYVAITGAAANDGFTCDHYGNFEYVIDGGSSSTRGSAYNGNAGLGASDSSWNDILPNYADCTDVQGDTCYVGLSSTPGRCGGNVCCTDCTQRWERHRAFCPTQTFVSCSAATYVTDTGKCCLTSTIGIGAGGATSYIMVNAAEYYSR